MLFLASATHDDTVILLPTVSLSTAECECCEGTDYILSLDFLIWSIGIGWGC